MREDDIRADEIDSAFREMGVDAPITKEKARLMLAADSAHRALYGRSNVFDEATHIRIHICELSDPPEALRQIVNLSNAAGIAALATAWIFSISASCANGSAEISIREEHRKRRSVPQSETILHFHCTQTIIKFAGKFAGIL